MSGSASQCPSLNAILDSFLPFNMFGTNGCTVFTMAGLIHTWHKSYTWKSSSIKIVCLGISRTNFFVFYVRWGSSNKEYLLQLLQLVKYCSCQWICQQLSEFFFLKAGRIWTPTADHLPQEPNEQTGRETIKCWHQWVEKKKKQRRTTKIKNTANHQTAPKEAAHVLFQTIFLEY